MKNTVKRSLLIFLILSLALAVVFFVFPINLFDGVIIRKEGLQELKINTPLSLSYFIGLGYDPEDMDVIVDFYLTTKGKLMAVLFIFGFPALIAYRMYLQRVK